MDFQAEGNIYSQMIQTREGIELLGCPIGSDAFMAACINRKVDKMVELMKAASQLVDCQVSYHLLRMCVGLPKFLFYLRSCSATAIASAIERFDMNLTASISKIIGYSKTHLIPFHTRLLWALPIREGGFGIPCAHLLSDIAYVSGVAATWDYQKLCQIDRPHESFYAALDRLGVLYPTIRSETVDEDGLPISFTQKELSDLMVKVLSSTLKSRLAENGIIPNELEERMNAIICGHTAPFASEWLTACPSPENQISSPSFQAALKYHSALELQSVDSRCAFGDQKYSDPYADHAISCSRTNQRIRRHNAICKVFFNWVRRARYHLAVMEKGTGELNQNRMGDIHIPNFSLSSAKDNGDVYFDVSVASTLCPSNIKKSAKEALAAAEQRAIGKRTKYKEQIRTKNFMPLVVETLGGLHKDVVLFIREIAEFMCNSLHRPVESIVRSIASEISVTLQRLNGQMLHERCR